MLTLPEAWVERAEHGTAEPIYLVQIDVGARVVFEVVDYTAGPGETATLSYNGVPYLLTEGVDFVAAVSNEETATRMAAAWAGTLPGGINVFPLGTKVYAVIDTADTIVGSSSNSSAWTLSISDPVLKYVSGSRSFGDYDAVVADVQSLSIEVDPLSRGVARTGEREVAFRDDGPGCVVRTLLAEYPDLCGKIVRLWIGFHDLDEADFVADGVYVISDAGRGTYDPKISLRLQDVAAKLDGAKVRVDVVNRHPLEAVEKVLIAAGVPAALYDATTLNPSAYAEIGHICLSRHKYGNGWNGIDGKSSGVTVEPRESSGKRNARGVRQFRRTFYDRADFGTIVEPVDALDLLNDLLQLLDGIFAPGEDGVYAFRRYEPAGTVVDEVAAADIADFDQPEKWRGAYNHVEVKGPHNLNGNAVLFEVEDRFAQARRAVAGGTRQRRTHTIESDWLTGVATLQGALAIGAGAGATVQVRNAQANGFSGLRAQSEPVEGGAPPAFTQDSNTDCTASRLVYLYLFHTTDGRREILSCDAATLVTTSASRNLSTWVYADYTVAERGLFGTAAEDWDATTGAGGPSANPNYSPGVIEQGVILVADVTVAVNVALRKLDRLAAGLPPIAFRGGLDLFRLQLGDLISIHVPQYFDQGQDGAGLDPLTGNTDAAFFEIISKEPQVLGAGPGVRFGAVLSSYATYKPLVPYYPPWIPPPTGGSIENNTSLQLDGVDDVIDYGDVTTLDNATSAIWAGWIRVLGSLHTADIWSRDDAGNEQFRLRVEGAEVSLEIGAAVAKSITNDSPLSLNIWHHIVAIYDGNSGVILLFVDNAKSTTTDTGTVPSQLPAPSGGSNLRLGAQSDSPDGTYLAARVDEWVIGASYGAAFTETDANELYNGGVLLRAGSVTNPPDHWFRFEQVVDDELGGLLGTPTGVPFFSSDTPN